jgi:cupin 2 domain-containing protein
MKTIKGNIFSSVEDFNGLPEIFESLYISEHFRIERIVTRGAISEPGEWYDQVQNEWVILLQGNAVIEFTNGKLEDLSKGEYLFIPAHCKHRLIKTSAIPNCIWLAIHENSIK